MRYLVDRGLRKGERDSRLMGGGIDSPSVLSAFPVFFFLCVCVYTHTLLSHAVLAFRALCALPLRVLLALCALHTLRFLRASLPPPPSTALNLADVLCSRGTFFLTVPVAQVVGSSWLLRATFKEPGYVFNCCLMARDSMGRCTLLVLVTKC